MVQSIQVVEHNYSDAQLDSAINALNEDSLVKIDQLETPMTSNSKSEMLSPFV